MITGNEIRKSFLDFFAKRSHTVVKSSSLVPDKDPTLLFTNAGMVQFKNVFLGQERLPYVRATSAQKCLRISGKHNDLEAVGRDTYHHTFFEMLGNWSFGDYYKEEAIKWHWELSTKVSEISIDRGEAACHPEKNHPRQKCFVNVDGCERFIELGNLVFVHYNRDESGALTPLPKKHVDTGTGLERTAAALQSLETGKVLGDYDIDLFRSIILRIQNIVFNEGGGHQYGGAANIDRAFRAIADHSRAIAFLIAEG